MKRHVKLTIIGGAIAVVMLAGGVAVWLMIRQQAKPVTSQASANVTAQGKAMIAAQPGQAGMDTFVSQYGPTYDSIKTGDLSANMSSWTRDDLDKLYYKMVYADNIGLFSQVQDILAQLSAAKRAGVNIDNNSFGIDQTKRDAMAARAEARQQAVTQQGAGQ